PRTLRFVAEDPGEAMDIGVLYTSRCPPRVIEHTVAVVAVAAPPITPALVPVYTESGCVRLQAPREAWKDEDAQWHVPPCAEAAQPPRLMELQQQQAEQQRENEMSGDNASVSVVKVCGVEAYKWCDVVWTARNLVAAVTQTFSLRRCMSPPQLLFHGDGMQREPLAASLEAYALPTAEWLEGDEDDTRHATT
ncbi:hypothetical protein DQ04_25151000, partial [Trypanosoma grayi]|uniref:hypothetical protein n=1 Tax=Trypanosoma grayi TaxID=71804 RepID=UPI0004F46EE5